MEAQQTPEAESPTSGVFRLTRPDGTTQDGSYESVGKAFAAGKFVGTFEKMPLPAPVIVAAPAPAPVVVEDAATRIGRHAEILKNAGFALPDPFFAPGTPLIQVGKDKFAAKRAEWEARLPVEEIFPLVAAKIAAEKRRDIVCDLKTLRMDEKGHMFREGAGKPPLPIEAAAFDKLIVGAAIVLPSARALLHTVDPDVRAEIWNKQIAKLPVDRPIKIGVRFSAAGTPQIYRAVSPGYGDNLPANVALTDAAALLSGQGMRGQITYDPATTRIAWDACWHAPVSIDPKVGDIFRAGLRGTSHDAGGGRFRFLTLIERILCVNLTTAEAYGGVVSRVHRGDMGDTRAEVQAMVARTPEIFAQFAADWQITREAEIAKVEISGVRYKCVEDALAGLVEREKISADVAKDTLLEVLLTGWKHEPGNSLADMINAITRSHTSSLLDAIQREALEKQASELVPVLAGWAREAGIA